ncbi:MAG: hypothetical protein NTAFB01_33680 [Nitrospira sp.]
MTHRKGRKPKRYSQVARISIMLRRLIGGYLERIVTTFSPLSNQSELMLRKDKLSIPSARRSCASSRLFSNAQ